MITPRATRLIRAGSLHAFRRAVTALASEGDPLDARDRFIVVPTRAAAALATSALEHAALQTSGAMLRPEFITARELAVTLAGRAAPSLPASRPEAREIVMGVACRAAADAGHAPPFHLRPGLIAEVLAFYDALVRRRKDIATFERLVLGRLEPGAEYDRGAERLVRQTRFLVSAFTWFERLCTERGLVDDRHLRAAALTTPAARPWRHAVIAVGDESRDQYGLCAADWDLLTRVPGLDRLDLVVTDGCLAGAWHELIHELLPGIQEVRLEESVNPLPVLRVPQPAAESDRRASRARTVSGVWESRDREEEIADFARWVRGLRRSDPDVALERVALVVGQPLPYVYLAREVLRSANVPCQTFEALPLAGEPYAALLDLVFSAVSTGVSRPAGIALLNSPHLRWASGQGWLSRAAAAAADEALSEHGYLGGLEALRRIVDAVETKQGSTSRALPALRVLLDLATELEPLRSEAPPAEHLDRLLTFLTSHDAGVLVDESVRSRHLRGRSAVLGILAVLRDDYRALDSTSVEFDRVASVVRRWIEAHTFAPRAGDGGVHVVDAESARFGDFDHVQLAGVVDGEWPERTHRNIFYGPAILRDLGWSAESECLDQARAAFVDLAGLPASVLTVSIFSLEEDAIVAPSSLLDELAGLELERQAEERSSTRILEIEALGLDPVALSGVDEATCAAVDGRLSRVDRDDPRFHGRTTGHSVSAYSLSGLERYQDCPFKFFAADVLRLAEAPEDEPFLSPRARGRFIHEVFQRFFEAWDAEGRRAITDENLVDARAMFAQVAEPMLGTLNESDASLERARLFGSAIAMGVADVVFGLEASSGAVVTGRWIESSFEGSFALGLDTGVRVPIRGIADRIDLLEGHRLRVVDYKTGYAPAASRALQVPVYALCAQERLLQRDGRPWSVAEAAYVAFTGRRTLVPIVSPGEDPEPVMAAARERVIALTGGVAHGLFPPRPHDPMLCRSCAYPSVCRKDYVDE